jgi:hypothetical protein
VDYIEGAGSRINRELEGQEQPNDKMSIKASVNRVAVKHEAKCQLAEQGYNNRGTRNQSNCIITSLHHAEYEQASPKHVRWQYYEFLSCIHNMEYSMYCIQEQQGTQ